MISMPVTVSDRLILFAVEVGNSENTTDLEKGITTASRNPSSSSRAPAPAEMAISR
jgi:hypothetical protein